MTTIYLISILYHSLQIVPTLHTTFITATGDLTIRIYFVLHLHCRDPYSLNDTFLLEIPCLAEYGGSIDPTISLGGYSELPYCCVAVYT